MHSAPVLADGVQGKGESSEKSQDLGQKRTNGPFAMRPEWQIGGKAQTLESKSKWGQPLIQRSKRGKSASEAVFGTSWKTWRRQSFPGLRFAFAAVESAQRR